ncbi:MAG: OmpA family protein [Bacteroidia bacterium]|nr:OmpA family protein [Bacteroidia bacterium]MDW8133607.1 OmpA family protein [Bacteroidia bacterium]
MPRKVLYASLGITILFAQNKSSKKVKQLIEEADKEYYTYRNPEKAAELYKQVISLDANNQYALYRLGRCYWYTNNTEQAVEAYQKALAVNTEANDTIYLDLGIAQKKIGRYPEAIQSFEEFLRRHKTVDILRKEAEIALEGCHLAQKLLAREPDYELVALTAANSQAGDYGPALFVVRGDTFLIFTSHRTGGRGNARFPEYGEPMYSDLWYVPLKSDSVFLGRVTGKVQNLGKKVNTAANDGSAVISPDGMTMYYSICGQGKYRKYWGCSIYQSTYDPQKKEWGPFEKIEAIAGQREVVVNSRGKKKLVPTYDAQPTLSPDGNLMYFVSDRDGGMGGTDIWYSQRVGKEWSVPAHTGKLINTPFNEIYPHVGRDGKTLYFASDGHPGLGGYDVFKAEGRLATWQQPQNLGSPINSSYDDFSLIWVRQDTLGFVASNRPGGRGRDDIYYVRRIFRPKIELAVHGTVRDASTKLPIPFATVTLYERQGGKLIPKDTFNTDQSATYRFMLEPGKDYTLIGNAPEYLANEVSVSTKDATKSMDLEADIDIFLDRIEIARPVVLQNIYFDFDKYDIRPDAAAELDRLATLLQQNPTLRILIGAHTDTNGSEQYNIKLSNNRAKSVVEYLKQKGINPKRLSWIGYGESQPLIYPELSDADEQANRRAEFRILGLDFAEK